MKKLLVILCCVIVLYFVVDYIRIDFARINAQVSAIENKVISKRADAELKAAYKRLKGYKILEQELGSPENVLEYLKLTTHNNEQVQ